MKHSITLSCTLALTTACTFLPPAGQTPQGGKPQVTPTQQPGETQEFEEYSGQVDLPPDDSDVGAGAYRVAGIRSGVKATVKAVLPRTASIINLALNDSALRLDARAKIAGGGNLKSVRENLNAKLELARKARELAREAENLKYRAKLTAREAALALDVRKSAIQTVNFFENDDEGWPPRNRLWSDGEPQAWSLTEKAKAAVKSDGTFSLQVMLGRRLGLLSIPALAPGRSIASTESEEPSSDPPADLGSDVTPGQTPLPEISEEEAAKDADGRIAVVVEVEEDAGGAYRTQSQALRRAVLFALLGRGTPGKVNAGSTMLMATLPADMLDRMDISAFNSAVALVNEKMSPTEARLALSGLGSAARAFGYLAARDGTLLQSMRSIVGSEIDPPPVPHATEVMITALGPTSLFLPGPDAAKQLFPTTVRLHAKVKDSSGATFGDVVWSTGNSAVARVDRFGLVVAVGTGSTAIKATSVDGRASSQAQVVVRTGGKLDVVAQ